MSTPGLRRSAQLHEAFETSCRKFHRLHSTCTPAKEFSKYDWTHPNHVAIRVRFQSASKISPILLMIIIENISLTALRLSNLSGDPHLI